MPASAIVTRERDHPDYVGWLAAGLVILAVFGIAAAFWFKYHP